MEITATCGHIVTYEPKPEHKFAQLRVQKLSSRPCRECRIEQAKKNDVKRSPSKVKKGQEVRLLPPGSLIQLHLNDDLTWTGELRAGGTFVSVKGSGLIGMVSKLTRNYLAAIREPEAA